MTIAVDWDIKPQTKQNESISADDIPWSANIIFILVTIYCYVCYCILGIFHDFLLSAEIFQN